MANDRRTRWRKAHPEPRAQEQARQNRYRGKRRAEKRCPMCGEPALDGYVYCEPCRDRNRERLRRRREGTQKIVKSQAPA